MDGSKPRDTSLRQLIATVAGRRNETYPGHSEEKKSDNYNHGKLIATMDKNYIFPFVVAEGE